MILEIFEGITFLVEVLAFIWEVARALGRGVAGLVRWTASPFRRRKAGAARRVVYGGRKGP